MAQSRAAVRSKVLGRPRGFMPPIVYRPLQKACIVGFCSDRYILGGKMTLEGKSALVTGGSRGIGRAICVRLAREGAYVIVHYGADRAAAEATVRDIHTAGGSATAVQAVLGGSETDREARELIERASSSTGKLDILVNNVGIVGPRNGIEAADADGLHRVFALNTITPFFVTKHSLGRLSDNGRIINISAH